MSKIDFNLENHWLPFTPNRSFMDNPRVLVGADGMYFNTHDGRRVLDGISSLWCVSAGHNRRHQRSHQIAVGHAGLRHRLPGHQRQGLSAL